MEDYDWRDVLERLPFLFLGVWLIIGRQWLLRRMMSFPKRDYTKLQKTIALILVILVGIVFIIAGIIPLILIL